MSREAMQLALEALENAGEAVYARGGIAAVGSLNIAAQALRKALEKKQEPVAWISDSPTKGNGKQLHWAKAEAWRWSSNITPLYTAPPKREWVGLSNEEINSVCYKRDWTAPWTDTTFARAIEEKLKEKNT